MGQAPLGRRTSRRASASGRSSATWTATTTPPSTRWFLEIARTFLGFTGDRVTAADADRLFDAAEKTFAQPDWEEQVFARSKLEKIFLTNEFDDPLEGFDTTRYVPCLRTDDAGLPPRQAGDAASGWRRRPASRSATRPTLRKAIGEAVRALHARKGAKACAISLPPDFYPAPFDDEHFYEQMQFHDFRRPAPAASSGCWPSTAASSGCRST